ncbi:hypothetical protein [Bradyrhizobium oligotrophicum]|uniref:hypothetical protein n=1 Tax=Bradyrhizobium oligotrophicum TaxID=44255 RepID=UPI00366AD3C8
MLRVELFASSFLPGSTEVPHHAAQYCFFGIIDYPLPNRETCPKEKRACSRVKRIEVFEGDFALLARNMTHILVAQHQFAASWFH